MRFPKLFLFFCVCLFPLLAGCGGSDVVSPEMTQERQQQFDATQDAVQNEEMQQALQNN